MQHSLGNPPAVALVGGGEAKKGTPKVDRGNKYQYILTNRYRILCNQLLLLSQQILTFFNRE
ncbi:hypothetical protein QUA82_15175 [Microcoleus sp. F8-D3]